MGRRLLVFFLAFLALAFLGGSTPADHPGTASAQVPALTKLSDRLSRMTNLVARNALAATAAEQARQLDLAESGPGSLQYAGLGSVLVDIRVLDTTPATLAELTAHGAGIRSVAPRYRNVTAAVQPPRIAELAGLPRVLFMQESLTPIVWSKWLPDGQSQSAPLVGCGAATSEGDTQLNAAAARTAYGIDGAGVPVGVLSDSYDTKVVADTHAANDILSGDLPGVGNPCGHLTPVQVISDPNVGSDEGRAMMQIVHDLAPGAPLKFSTAFTSHTDFATQITNLQLAGAKVISDDVIYFDEPMYQDGPIAVAANEARAAGVFLTSSAGNTALFQSGNNWNGYESPAFRGTTDCPSTIISNEGITLDCHEFNTSGAADITYGFRLAGNGGTVRIVLQWAEPWYGVTSDLDLFVVSHGTNTVQLFSTDRNASSQKPFEFVGGTNNNSSALDLDVVVANYGGTPTPRFKILFLMNGSSAVSNVEYATVSSPDTTGSQIYGHNGAASELSLAATAYNDGANAEVYSSRGPVTILYGPVDGITPAALLGTPQVLAKPDVTATDGGLNTFFGGSSHRFYGTSAAAPHAAGVAALLLNVKPNATPDQIKTAILSTAAAMSGGPNAVGAGRIDALAAANALATGPAFTSANNVTFNQGVLGNFLVTTSGNPAPSLSRTGALPSGVSFVDNGNGTATLGGTAGPGTGGVYPLTLTATNGAGSVNQSFTLTVLGAGGTPPTLAKSFGAASIGIATKTTLTFNVGNPNASSLTGVGFTDILPAGLVLGTPLNLTGSCGGGTITALPGGTQLVLSGATLPANGSCAFTVDVLGTTLGNKVNTTGAPDSNETSAGAPASASVQVVVLILKGGPTVPPAAPPVLVKSFSKTLTGLNGTATLSFSVANPNPVYALTGMSFTDVLPAGLKVAPSSVVSGSCGGGTISATPGGSNISLTGASLGSGQSCVFSVTVVGISLGLWDNVTSPISSNEAGSGAPGTASLRVDLKG